MVKPMMNEDPAVPTSQGTVLVIERVIRAPQALVWEAFSDAEHRTHWWGPNGFSTTTHAMDFRVGGAWRFTMHGPDGTDYPNFVRYTVIDAPNRLEYDHRASEDGPPHFYATITFEAVQGGTRLTLNMDLHSIEALEEARKFGAVEGGQQTLARLAARLESRGS